jgi:hypothetical protein
MVLILLSVRWLSFKNTIRRGTLKESRSVRASLFFTLVIATFIGIVSYSFLSPFAYLARSSDVLAAALDRMPSLALFTAFWMLLLSAVTVSIQRFYLNQEVTLLLSAPVDPGTVFSSKLAECTLANANLFLLLALPMSIAYGSARGLLSASYLVQAAAVMAAFSVLPTTIGVVLSFLLMRSLPPTKTRDLLGAFGIMVFACLYFVLSIAATRSHNYEALSEGAYRFAEIVSSPVLKVGPWAWGGSVLIRSGNWIPIAYLALAAALCFGIARATAGRIYWRGWSSLQETAISVSQVAAKGTGRQWLLRYLSGPVRAVILKDLYNLRRDLRQLSLLLIPIAVVAVFLFQVADSPARAGTEFILMAGLLPILAMISLRLAMSAFISESRALWLMLGAPIEARTVLFGKFLYAYTLAAPLASLATLAYCLIKQMDWGISALSLGLTLCSVAGFCGVGVGSNALFTDFAADPAKATASAGGRLVTFALQMGYLVALGIILAGAWLAISLMGRYLELVYLLAAVAVLLATVAAILLPLSLAANRLRKLEW